MFQFNAANQVLHAKTHHILQRSSTKHLEHRVGFGGRDTQNDGLLAHSGGVLIQGGTQFPVNTNQQLPQVHNESSSL